MLDLSYAVALQNYTAISHMAVCGGLPQGIAAKIGCEGAVEASPRRNYTPFLVQETFRSPKFFPSGELLQGEEGSSF